MKHWLIPVVVLGGVAVITLRTISIEPYYRVSPVTQKDKPAISGGDTLLVRGKELYERMCATCHGRNGDAFPITPEALITSGGDVIWARDFTGKTHNAGKVVFKYTWGGANGEFATDEELKYIIRHGLYGTPMPGFEYLSEDELNAIIAYIKTFSERWKEFKPYTIPQVNVPPDLHSSARIERGRALFKQKCLTCHMDQEAGQNPIKQPTMWKVPGTDSIYSILSRDFRKEPLRFPEPENIYRTIKVGIGGTPMNPSLWQDLADSSLWDLVAYVLFLRESKTAQK